MDCLKQLYFSLYHVAPNSIEAITGSGSARKYYRLSDEKHSVIGTIGPSRQENEAFIYLSNHFRSKGLPVPRVLMVSDDHAAYLQEDLGAQSLYDTLQQARNREGAYGDKELHLLRRTMEELARFQFIGLQGLDTSYCYPTAAMDATSIMFDLNYFKYCFLKLMDKVEFNEISLQKDFELLCHDICAMSNEDNRSLVLRDFQARNVMLYAKKVELQPYFIDYQGCRIGPAEYDVASFLWQASARYSQCLRDSLISTYISAAQTLRPIDGDKLRHRLQLMVFFRLLQVLGAYGFRGYYERKPYFLHSIPQAIDNLYELLQQGVADKYAYLHKILNSVVDIIRAEEEAKKHIEQKDSDLTVTIWSFSFRKGIPEDNSGNGGGYVFDCRGIHNPGRYDRYKSLTGLDEPVIRFLEDDGEITFFLQNIYPIAQKHVARYIERGFASLQFCFGCTGGQHRSVYSAQHLASYLHNAFPRVRIRLIHREQGIDHYL